MKINAAIVSEPDVSEFLQLRMDAFSGDNPYYPIEHVSHDHPVHGYVIRVPKDDKGVYKPDEIQTKAIQQALDFFKKSMSAAGPR